MRILVISNLYPPHYLGGYELACKDVVERLKTRGHDLWILCGDYGVAPGTHDEAEAGIYRLLTFHTYNEPLIPLWQFAWSQYRNRLRITRMIRRVRPDVVYIWGMGRMEMSLPADSFINTKPNIELPRVFAFSDRWLLGEDAECRHWMQYWEHRPSNSVKRTLKPLVNRFVAKYLIATSLRSRRIPYAHFFSHALQRQYEKAGVHIDDSRVIYHGVALDRQKSVRSYIGDYSQKEPLRLLYSGRLDPQKGVHTALEAIAVLVNDKLIDAITLTIIGPQTYPDYVDCLRDIIKKCRLNRFVCIREKVSREKLERIYNEHDALIFPSIWDEPFSITIVEAMAHGLVVISTPTGGSAEILQDAENSLVFPAEDAEALAERIEALLNNPGLTKRIGLKAVETIQRGYSLDKVVDQIEEYLTGIVRKRQDS